MPRNRRSHHQNGERPTPARPDCNFAFAPHGGINETWAVFHVHLRPAGSDHFDLVVIMDRKSHRILGGELLDPGDTAGIADLLSCVAHHEGRPFRLVVGGGDKTLSPSVVVAASELGLSLTPLTEEHANLRWAMAGLTDAMADSATTMDLTDRLSCMATNEVLNFIGFCFDVWNSASFDVLGGHSPDCIWAARTSRLSA